MIVPIDSTAAADTVTSTVIVLLAAGESRRYGGIKQLARIGDEPMVRRAARSALATGAPLIVVTGAHAEQVEAALADLPLRIVRCATWQQGMGSSLAAGIRDLHDRFPAASGVLLCLADQPLLDSAALTQLLIRHKQVPLQILATEQAGTAGPPVLFPRDCLAALMDWSGQLGARALLDREADRVELFVSPDAIDVDTPDDLRRVCDALSNPRPG
jgi:molybdenum cofactor cytidylyltransferase